LEPLALVTAMHSATQRRNRGNEKILFSACPPLLFLQFNPLRQRISNAAAVK
jgi:hypothetical protein